MEHFIFQSVEETFRTEWLEKLDSATLNEVRAAVLIIDPTSCSRELNIFMERFMPPKYYKKFFTDSLMIELFKDLLIDTIDGIKEKNTVQAIWHKLKQSIRKYGIMREEIPLVDTPEPTDVCNAKCHYHC